MKTKRKKRAITLIEIMIVILLIGLIGGALAVNMRGSMDKGRVFKTEQNINRVYDALMMEYASVGGDLASIVERREEILNHCPFIKNGAQLLTDAWGGNLNFEIDQENDELLITSTRLEQWRARHG